ncbi:hypothetical protein BD324DRAFT_387296 [Kockovaella imperatae]|uniref:Uncharacterized protein n=1 Tax=Kockovaella imperatae TaxID=4999 RepID=A0A1Y1UJD0_9TREE|nr:hypothetical protein BD324DRAFT_387296 [Kockovaella imperatae]ORX37604.1 hypothetical protein BD324DRAFT_387296 [Kockovaella imperatae]
MRAHTRWQWTDEDWVHRARFAYCDMIIDSCGSDQSTAERLRSDPWRLQTYLTILLRNLFSAWHSSIFLRLHQSNDRCSRSRSVRIWLVRVRHLSTHL